MAYLNYISKSELAGRRQQLMANLEPGACVILVSGTPIAQNTCSTYNLYPNRSFFYLTGIEQENSVLILQKEAEGISELLLIEEYSALKERWEGKLLTAQEATAISGLVVESNLDWEKRLAKIDAQSFYLDLSDTNPQALKLKASLGGEFKDIEPRLIDLRQIKSPAENKLLGKALEITYEGIKAILKTAKAGVRESELYGAFANELAKHACLKTAFPTIAASGKNALCLHYRTPFDILEEDDLVLIDLGAVYGGYNADITRVFPVSGRFNARQKQLYKMVRACQETAFAFIQEGVKLAEINEACKETAKQHLVEAGLMTVKEDAAKYYWHNVSHHLGLDTHDLCRREDPLAAGAVITVEPGIYIPEWNLGFRLEDDVLVQKDSSLNLSAFIPREWEEIEELMQQLRS